MWQRIEELPAAARIGGSAALPSLPAPALCYSMDVNALNFCRFALLPLPALLPTDGADAGPAAGTGAEAGAGVEVEPSALLALPNLVDSSTVRGGPFRAHRHG